MELQKGLSIIDFPTQLLKYKKIIVITFIVIALISAVVQFGVSVNYNMTDYLPENAPSTKAIDMMEQEFTDAVDNTRIMIKDVSLQEALTYKKEIAEVDGVLNVMWLDDIIDLTIPIEMADKDLIETYYYNDNALFTLEVENDKEVVVTEALYDIIGPNNAMSGEALDTAISQQATGRETFNAAAILVPIIIIILILSTRSWIEPVFFLTAIGVSVLINLGTNIFIGEISFISQAVAPILQLAVSLDYAIFLLHSFERFRKKLNDPEEAMKRAMRRSFPAITASAATTFFGFMALTFMKFEIGADLGLNLVKGILLSFLSVMIFLPALTLMFYKFIDKTEHKQWLPNKYNIGKHTLKLKVPILIFVLLLIVPAFLAQSKTNFLYGMGEIPENTRAGEDVQAIEAVFGKYTPVVLLVSEGDFPREEQLINDLQQDNNIKSVISYTESVGVAIPPEYVEKSTREQFLSDNYSRIILNTTVDAEGDQSFKLVETIRHITDRYYDDYYMTGENVTLYDMKAIVEVDNKVVNILTVVTIAIVLLITFRSLSFPIVLLFTIQTSVWFNLSIPYFTNDSLVYIGYLIISIVQLAATVDYAILFSEDYTNKRKSMTAMIAIKKTINEKIFSIAVPASILSSVGFILWLTSSDPIISSIGILLGRGTLLAFTLVVLLLPALLIIFDKVIKKTTWKAGFYEEE